MKTRQSVKEWKARNIERHREHMKKGSRIYRARHKEKLRISERARKARARVGQKQFHLSLKMERGGMCALCSFDKEPRILQFHHLRDKKFELSRYEKSQHKMREEAEKCVLLCPNCHALQHLKK